MQAEADDAYIQAAEVPSQKIAEEPLSAADTLRDGYEPPPSRGRALSQGPNHLQAGQAGDAEKAYEESSRPPAR